jgi:hypothetical protein
MLILPAPDRVLLYSEPSSQLFLRQAEAVTELAQFFTRHIIKSTIGRLTLQAISSHFYFFIKKIFCLVN